jgi:hypothetical protein
MDSHSVHTMQLKNWLVRMRAGDLNAREELLQSVHDRLERLARKMLRGFPSVKAKEQTVDVLDNALMRLLRALPETEPASMREFFGLAALQIRRELKDLAKFYGRKRRKVPTPLGSPPRAELDDSILIPRIAATIRPSWSDGRPFTRQWTNCPRMSAR